ncbi:DUF6702 family protein [Chryseolinea sp. T2]|uniref:DUF6702 family protein n=1 Tax=Chryseolinea sp. T2 TaxID=3129255 RepID=UPI0030789994
MTFYAFLIALPMHFAAWLHPMHVSVTEIEMDEKEKRLEIMMRVFIDDLETTMRQSFRQPELDVLEPKGQSLDELMQTYLKTRFSVSLDGKTQVIKYLGHERDHEAFIFYVEVDKVKKWKAIQVQNSIITEAYDDQSNLVHVTRGETVRSLRLTRSKPSDIINFESE